MLNHPSERMAGGLLEAFWVLGPATLLRPCDGCHEPIEPDEKCFRPVGFFTKPEIPHMTARDLKIREWYCMDCGPERQAFLAEAFEILKSAQAGEKQ